MLDWLMVQKFETKTFDDPDRAVARVTEIYDHAVARLESGFTRAAMGESSGADSSTVQPSKCRVKPGFTYRAGLPLRG